MNQLISVVQINVLCHSINNFISLVKCDLETIGDSCWMDSFSKEISACLEESPSHDDDRGGSVTDLSILDLRELHEDFGGRVGNFKLL